MKRLFALVLIATLAQCVTAQVTVKLLKDINVFDPDVPSSEHSSVLLGFGGDYKGYHYFSGYDPVHSSELWRTDGTPEGTELFMEINPRSIEYEPFSGSWPQNFFIYKDLLYFAAYNEEVGRVWHTDGTFEGTKMTDIVPDNFIYPVNDRLVIYGITGLSVADGTGNVGEKYPVQIVYSGPTVLTYSHDSSFALLPLTSEEYGSELWRTDGTISGTYMVKDINPGPAHSAIDKMIRHNGIYYFRATTAESGSELWRSDGTEQGTYMVKDICPGSCDGLNYYLSKLCLFSDNLIYFSAFTPEDSWSMFSTDGTEAGTSLVFSPEANYLGINGPVGYQEINNKIVYLNLIGTEDEFVNALELWVLDKDTRVHEMLLRGPWDGALETYSLGNMAFVTMQAEGVAGTELWQTDGTTANTKPAIFTRPFNASSKIQLIRKIGDSFYFTAMTNGYRQLWKVNGTCNVQLTAVEGDVMDYHLIGNRMLLIIRGTIYGEELFYYNLEEEKLQHCIITNVDDDIHTENVILFPNPMDERISFKPAIHASSVRATDVFGRGYVLPVLDNSCDTNLLPKGIYFIWWQGLSKPIKVLKR